LHEVCAQVRTPGNSGRLARDAAAEKGLPSESTPGSPSVEQSRALALLNGGDARRAVRDVTSSTISID
jgi:hypothetical protein